MELVSSVVQLLDNIKLYNEHADRFAELMPYNRSWYALRTDVGWLLGPSKYIGYQNLSPEEYLGSLYSAEKRGRMVQHNKSALPLDGRVTEGVLKRWSVLVEEGHPDHESLHSALNALCARYGKKPNSLARISIIKEGREASAPGFSDELVTLLAAVFRGLTPAQKIGIPQTNRVKHGSRSISRYYEGIFFFTGCDANGVMGVTTARAIIPIVFLA